MNVETNTPEIRFMGFSESWLHKTIDDLINEEVIYPPKDGNHGGIHPKATDYVEYGIPFIMANNIRGGEIHYGGCYHISLQQAQTLQKGFAKTGDILLTHKGTVGEVAIIGRIEFPYLMLTPQVTYYRICDTSKLDTYFLATAFRSNSFQKPLKEEAGGGTRAYIGITAQKGLELSIPQNIEEQKELGNYFQKLDNLINQHQQKHDKLSNLKKAMLEKMFPKAGETVPEIRFDGFSGEWLKVKLKSIATVKRGLTYKPADLASEGIAVLRSSNIDVDRFLFRSDDVYVRPEAVNIDSINNGDILVTAANGSSHLVGKHAVITEMSPIQKAVHGGFMLAVTTESPYFLNASMNTYWYRRFLSVNVAGGNGAIGNIKGSALEQEELFVPEVAEQAKIGIYFQKLDALINQHKQQITKLKNIKQACLDKMFV